MSLKEAMATMLPALETELRQQVGRLDVPTTHDFHEMLAYHMGWNGQETKSEHAGKRIRPLLLLLVSAACEEQWLHALPAAAAVELVHNFSLIHDDIQDNSPTRRGRLTVWKKYGAPMAINAGDALFTIASQAMLDLSKSNDPDTVVKATRILHNACLELTQGQFLDLAYQKRTDLSVADYFPMIDGKTAALISAATEIGAILGGAPVDSVEQYRSFGRNLGYAFQVQDDILGIWGNEATTGKSTATDLVEGKNSLPVLYAINKKGRFAERWSSGHIATAEVPQLTQVLRDEGAYDYSYQEAQRLTGQALDALNAARPRDAYGTALVELTHQLLQRDY
jgi:geranylgeranyl diphosphate synthase, type I